MATRRQFLAAGGRVAAAGLLAGCSVPVPGGSGARRSGTGSGTSGGGPVALEARPPGEPAGDLPAPGTRPVELGTGHDPLLHVPPDPAPGRPLPLVVTLHGAGGDAEGGLALLRPIADERGLLLLAPSSQGSTWDAIRGGYGPDLEVVDRALGELLATVPVAPDRIAVAGFSDGASYALGLGLGNGDLFAHVVAFSPGFVPGPGRRGRPAVFVSHGTADDVLPIDRTGRRIVADLRDEGYDVTYREFEGGHTVPPDVAREALGRLA